jgi:hypothetical protein
MSIAEFVRLSGRRDLTPAQLGRILTLDALPSSWKESLIEKMARRGMAR